MAGATNGRPLLRASEECYEWHGHSFPHMYYVYVIQSIAFPKQFYTGFSEYIDNRLEDHNSGKSVHTNKFKPWKMIYYCAFDNKKKALDFEKYLKTASGIAFRNKRLI
jgi:predicted GIY-YIG superfamily endonuclease